jgi:hypothetical protein
VEASENSSQRLMEDYKMSLAPSISPEPDENPMIESLNPSSSHVGASSGLRYVYSILDYLTSSQYH